MINGFCSKYEEKFFWTLKEVLDPANLKEEYNLNNEDVLAIVATMSGYSSPLIENAQWKEANVAKLIDLIIKRFHSFICYSTMSGLFSVQEQKNFIAKLLYVIEMTSPRYLKLLELYVANANNLLNPVLITNDSSNRFNDTPQNSGDFSSDPFTTNISQIHAETQNEVDTIMGRLREIESSYNNVLLNWSNEFESLFLEGDNI